MYWQTPVK